MRTLLLGMGNPILADDAVGVNLATDFKKRCGPVPGLDYVEECSVGGLSILHVLEGYERLIVLDSIKTRGGRPGQWYQFTAGALRETMHLANVHDANFATALELGRRLGMRLPSSEDIHIFAIEVRDNLSFSEQMTEELVEAYPRCADEIFRALSSLLGLPERLDDAG